MSTYPQKEQNGRVKSEHTHFALILHVEHMNTAQNKKHEKTT